MITADVLLVAEHFIMVTTVEVDYSPDQRDVENSAWKILGERYGIDWVAMTKPFIKRVSIEVVETPTPAEPSDTLGGGEGE